VNDTGFVWQFSVSFIVHAGLTLFRYGVRVMAVELGFHVVHQGVVHGVGMLVLLTRSPPIEHTIH